MNMLEPNDVLVEISPIVIDFVDRYAEEGLYLPPSHATDPAAWTNILRDIQKAFRLLELDPECHDEIMVEDIDKGLRLFVKHIQHLKM